MLRLVIFIVLRRPARREQSWIKPSPSKSFVQYPPRKLQSDGYTGPITISGYQKFEDIKKQLQNYHIDVTAQ